MKKWNLIIDVEKCEDCNNCFLSCKDEYVDNEFSGYSVSQPKHEQKWINIMRRERGQCPMIDVAYLPIPCMHCDNAPCIRPADKGAVYKRKDGIVIIDPGKAKGLAYLVDLCPYGAIWWNEEKECAQKCTFCAHLLDEGWREPRCVQACPTGALRAIYVEDLEMSKIIEQENLEVYMPNHKTKPRVYYKNLYRFLKCFIGGSVAILTEGREECVEGAKVTLKKGSERIREATTETFGEFKFDDLDENSGEYLIEIIYGQYKKDLKVALKNSMYLGCTVL